MAFINSGFRASMAFGSYEELDDGGLSKYPHVFHLMNGYGQMCIIM